GKDFIRWDIEEVLSEGGKVYRILRYVGGRSKSDLEMIVDPNQGYLITSCKTFDRNDGGVNFEWWAEGVEVAPGYWFPHRVTIHRETETIDATVSNIQFLDDTLDE